MRLWHKDLIPVLPRQQLLAQWRECCCIAKTIAERSSPHHILVNKIMDYSMWHFYWYTKEVTDEMKKRGYKVNYACFDKWTLQLPIISENINHKILFANWHNDRYLKQCYYNLQEKYDCGGITPEEWHLIENNIHIETPF